MYLCNISVGGDFRKPGKFCEKHFKGVQLMMRQITVITQKDALFILMLLLHCCCKSAGYLRYSHYVAYLVLCEIKIALNAWYVVKDESNKGCMSPHNWMSVSREMSVLLNLFLHLKKSRSKEIGFKQINLFLNKSPSRNIALEFFFFVCFCFSTSLRRVVKWD